MKLNKYLIAAICLFVVFGSKAYSQVFSFETTSSTGTAVLPRGTLIKTTLQETVSSNNNLVGDIVSFVTIADMQVGNAICIPKDAILVGKIVQLEKAKQGRDGYFQILIDEITFADGWHTNLAAKIWTRDGTGVIGGKPVFSKEYKKIPHRIENIGQSVQLVKVGSPALGQERAVSAGSEIIIVLDDNLQVTYLENLE